MADRKEGTVKWFNAKKGMVLFPVKVKRVLQPKMLNHCNNPRSK